MLTRPSKEAYYLGIAENTARRSNCMSTSGGAIIVRDDQIVSTGYIGAPRKVTDCMELGYCIRRKKGVPSGTGYEMCRSVHAEMNAIINAARAGVSLLGGDLYLWFGRRDGENVTPTEAFPCMLCKKMMINAGLKRFIGSLPDGSYKVHKISDWVDEWKTLEDLTQSKVTYQTDYSKQMDYHQELAKQNKLNSGSE
jgi:dCMP deaminase